MIEDVYKNTFKHTEIISAVLLQNTFLTHHENQLRKLGNGMVIELERLIVSTKNS